VATPKLYVGARAGYYLTNHTNANVTEAPLYVFQSDNHDFLDVPPDLQQDFGFRTDLTNDVSKVDRLSRVNAQVDGTYYGSFAGRHMLKAGVQLDRRANDVDKGASANVVNIFWDRSFQGQRGRYGNYRVQSNPIDPKRGIVTTGTVSDTTVGLFVQDAWTVHDRLTVNAGLRTENETVPFYNPTAAPPDSLPSTSRSVTSSHRGSARRGTSRATADGRCTAAGASSTTSSSSRCPSRGSEGSSSLATSTRWIRTTGQAS
jgi:hypothetical protein